MPETEIRAHLQAARLARSLVLEAGCSDETPILAPPPPPRAIEPVHDHDIEDAVVRRSETVRKQGPKPPPRPRVEPPRPTPKAPRQTRAPRQLVGQLKLERAIGLAHEGALHADIAEAVGWTTVTLSCEFQSSQMRGRHTKDQARQNAGPVSGTSRSANSPTPGCGTGRSASSQATGSGTGSSADPPTVDGGPPAESPPKAGGPASPAGSRAHRHIQCSGLVRHPASPNRDASGAGPQTTVGTAIRDAVMR